MAFFGVLVVGVADGVPGISFSLSVVAGMLGSLAFDSADVLFETAAGVVVDGVVFVIEDCVASTANGVAYCYCLKLRAPVR